MSIKGTPEELAEEFKRLKSYIENYRHNPNSSKQRIAILRGSLEVVQIASEIAIKEIQEGIIELD